MFLKDLIKTPICLNTKKKRKEKSYFFFSSLDETIRKLDCNVNCKKKKAVEMSKNLISEVLLLLSRGMDSNNHNK